MRRRTGVSRPARGPARLGQRWPGRKRQYRWPGLPQTCSRYATGHGNMGGRLLLQRRHVRGPEIHVFCSTVPCPALFGVGVESRPGWVCLVACTRYTGGTERQRSNIPNTTQGSFTPDAWCCCCGSGVNVINVP